MILKFTAWLRCRFRRGGETPDGVSNNVRKISARKNRQLGQWGEKTASRYLQKKGYRHICSNYRSSHGEIDLIMQQGKTLVFIEVKTRRNEDFVRTEQVVNYRKRKHIAKTAKDYIRCYKLYKSPCRFDVVIIIKPDKGPKTIRHYEHAFKMPY